MKSIVSSGSECRYPYDYEYVPGKNKIKCDSISRSSLYLHYRPVKVSKAAVQQSVAKSILIFLLARQLRLPDPFIFLKQQS